MDRLAVFNSLEAVFWMTTGVIVLRKSRSVPEYQRLGLISFFWLILFGVSDIFEVFTGAWWRPWPLLLLKVTCVVALTRCVLIYRAHQSRRKDR